ncbi:hypothetical protein SAMN06265360_1076 [Haloechinothrix alba]|uniref:Uncharacterized protein n=1 Tax=Haloechinothrix alba TaxID=664784 RepID=A0A238WMW8_9PSEU|nr:hypothetical protein [Haloechinothrix alba]SNR47885.1 hypothetical protein SAMN06265360_1076 [Haloechinothrix alba]
MQFPTDAAELDRLIREHPERLAELAEYTPSWLGDQLRSAARDSHRAASHLPGEHVHAEPPRWLRLAALAALLTFAEGTATTCRCRPRIDRPQPIIAAAWMPGTVACRRHAIEVLTEGVPDDADTRCDACGVVPPGGLHTGQVVLGPMILFYAACAECRTWTDSEREGTR